MSDENNNNETSKNKNNISPNDQDNITTITNVDNKNPSNLNSPKKQSQKDLLVNLLSFDRKSSTKTSNELLENESIKTERTLKDLAKRGSIQYKSIRKKRKKGKKGKKAEQHETQGILLTEVKKVAKKKEESENHKFLRKKLENLNFSKNLQMAINLGFEKAKEDIKDNLVNNYKIDENKKNTFEEIISNRPKTNLKLNINSNKKGIKYKIDKE